MRGEVGRTAELLPCPFCGGRAKLAYNRVAEDAMIAKVYCPKCLAQTNEFEDASAPTPEACAAWNARAASTSPDLATQAETIKRLEEENVRLQRGLTMQNDEICQALGKALGYPWFKDDQVNFSGATEANGVCVGDHVAESLVGEAAKEIGRLRAALGNIASGTEDTMPPFRAMPREYFQKIARAALAAKDGENSG